MLRRAATVILAFLVLAAPARGQTWDVPRAPAAVALAGHAVTWLQPGRERTDLYVATPGGAPRRVERLAAADAVDLAASASRTAVAVRNGDGFRVLAGSVGSRLTRVASCAAAAAEPWVDVSGDRVAYPRCDGRLAVRDLGHGGPDLVFGASVEDAQIAGRFVAWIERGGSEPPRVVVHDTAEGVDAYSFPADGVSELTLQANGKVAFVLDSGPSGLKELGWATPRQPRANRLDIANRFAYRPRMAGGRVVFGRDRAKSTDDGGRELGIVAPWSPHARILSRRLTATGAVDFDGQTIAYAERRAHGAAIRTRKPQP